MKQIHTIVWEEDDWFVAKALEVEVASQGKSEKDAIKNLKEALELYFEDEDSDEMIEIKNPKLQDIAIQLHV